MSMISYAQNYEDVMLSRALADVSEGFYVDVGAQHPINGSVTKAFQLRGWHGINIEPVERWFRLICDDRPNDINLCVPISNLPGYIELFDVENTGLSTIRSDYASTYSEAGWNVTKHTLKAHTLNSVFRAYAPRDVHFLKVDVEGAEASVLRSLDFKRFRPWIVLVEATKPNSPEPVFDEWESLLLIADYMFVYDDGLNRFYVAREHEDRARHFTRPPNFFDDFMPYSEWWAREQMDRLSHELEHERAELKQFRDNRVAVIEKVDDMERPGVEVLNSLFNERLTALADRLESYMDSRIDAGVGRLSEQLERGLAESVARYNEGVVRNERRLVAMMSELESFIETHASTDAITDVDGRVSAIEEAVKHVHDRLVSVQSHLSSDELTSIGNRMSAVEAAVGHMHERLVVVQSHATTEAVAGVSDRVAAVETSIDRVHDRLAFADNVHAAFLHAVERERAAEARLQEILRSRSWRAMGAGRFVARTLRALLGQRSISAPQSGSSARQDSVFVRFLVAAVRHPPLRRIGSVLLRMAPGLKTRLVRIVVSNAPLPDSQPLGSSESVPGTGSCAHLPGRARIVRAMLDSAMKSS